MPTFLKPLLMGAWVILLLDGASNANRPVLSGSSDQELFLIPSTFIFSWEPAPRSYFSNYTTPPEQVSIATLLDKKSDYHQHLVAVRGLVTQPELHLDESQMFFNFVFRLADGGQSIVVFGRHDRTQGAPSISLDLSVEVVGIFWKQRILNESHITNTIEAVTVAPYPSLIPDSA